MTSPSTQEALDAGAALLPALSEPLRTLWQRMLLEMGRLLHWSIDPAGAPRQSPTLLPPNATSAEHRIEQATERLGNLPTPLRPIWNPDTCPANLLPWLAWALQVDVWDAEWSEDARRQTVRGALDVNRKKGTPWAVRRALDNAGYTSALLQEGDPAITHNAASAYDGAEAHIGGLDWANYRLILPTPITNAQADQVRRLLNEVAPARCHLIELVWTEIANNHNATAYYDGTYNHGTA